MVHYAKDTGAAYKLFDKKQTADSNKTLIQYNGNGRDVVVSVGVEHIAAMFLPEI